jgi:hypothetical protein
MRRALACLLAVLLVTLACARRAPAPPAPPPPRPFAQDRAWSDFEQLAAIGERPSGSPGAEAARAHVRAELEKAGIDVRELSLEAQAPPAPGAKPDAPAAPPVRVVHLLATIPGDSADIVLLGASYDGPHGAGPAADAAASGPALLLELARAIAARPLPYTTWLVFLDGDLGGGSAETRIGSGAFARQLAFDGDLQRIRLGVFFRRVASADLHLQRDLLSHRPSREAIWRAGVRNGGATAFAPNTAFSSPVGAHLALFQVGVRRAVILAGAGEPLAPADDTVEGCSAQSLGIVGQAALDGLDEITRTMVKVDRLAPGAAKPSEVPATGMPEDFAAPGEPEAPQSE